MQSILMLTICTDLSIEISVSIFIDWLRQERPLVIRKLNSSAPQPTLCVTVRLEPTRWNYLLLLSFLRGISARTGQHKYKLHTSFSSRQYFNDEKFRTNNFRTIKFGRQTFGRFLGKFRTFFPQISDLTVCDDIACNVKFIEHSTL